MSNLIRIGSLWKSDKKDSRLVASGQLGGKYGPRLLLFKRDNRDNRQPHYDLCVTEDDRKDADKPATKEEFTEITEPEGDDLPF